MRDLFSSRKLNDTGIGRVKFLEQSFNDLVDAIDLVLQRNSRERSLMLTKLEEASFYAKKAMSFEDDVQAEDVKEPK